MDAVLLIAFGGPRGRGDIRPFLANVLRGRRVSAERVEEVAHHYEIFDGISPLTELTMRQAAALEATLRARGHPLPVYVGMRNWDPYLRDTLARMSRDGVRRAIGVIAAAHRSYSSCLQYRENVADARRTLHEMGLPDVQVTFVNDWHLSEGFIDANADHVRRALDAMPATAQNGVEIVFTAHSIPVPMASAYPYEQQIQASAEAVLQRLEDNPHVARGTWHVTSDPHVARGTWHVTSDEPVARGTWHVTRVVVFQSRSGRPEDPWLEPDVCDYLRDAAARGVPGVVLCPIGFVCDHIEVLYDLDVEAAGVARDLGLPLSRAAAANDHPRFIDALAEAVEATVTRYSGGRPLPLVAAPAPLSSTR